jgi:hypothetical protein
VLEVEVSAEPLRQPEDAVAERSDLMVGSNPAAERNFARQLAREKATKHPQPMINRGNGQSEDPGTEKDSDNGEVPAKRQKH